MEINGQVIVITGGGSGIGAATAQLAAQRGARVALIDANRERLTETASQIRSQGGEVVERLSDVTDATTIADDVSAVMDAWGQIDSLVTAAGILHLGTLLEIGQDDWQKVFDVNVNGTWLWCQALLPIMQSRKSGAIVTISSQLAVAGGRERAPYVASKGAVLSLTRNLALDFAVDGIRVNCVVPGPIETPMLRGSLARRVDPDGTVKALLARSPMGRLGRPEEVAEAALFLLGSRSSYVTGATFHVDGGWLAA